MADMLKEFITSVELQSYFVDKVTGAPLSGGYVEFFKNSNRTMGKQVYQKVQNGFDVSGDPLYQFITLGDVVQLSGVGTFMDNTNNDISIYYYPWDEDGNLELYYIAVFDILGNPQLTREGWPNTYGTDNPDAAGSNISENQISNPQFAVVNFNPLVGLSITLTGSATDTIALAPNWNLVVSHSGDTTVQVTRTSVAGSSNLPTQPPYYLTITPGANTTQIQLVQNLPHNPGIWSPTEVGVGGYVAATMLLGPNTPTTSLIYRPSSGTATTLLTEVNASSNYVEYQATVQLPPSNNAQTSDAGSVSIVVNMSVVTPTIISSIQVVGLDGNIQNVAYEQETVNRQLDHLFNYYNPLLQFKPIPSYLTAWDFSLNPSQFLGKTIAPFTTGDNTSNYLCDQTIIFQTVDNSFNSALGTGSGGSGALVITPTKDTQVALIQYLPINVAQGVVYEDLCSMVQAVCQTDSYDVTLSVWYSTNASLPSTVVSNQSIVTGLDANGFPTVVSGWTEIPRSNLGKAQFTLKTPGMNNPGLSFGYYGFSGWQPLNINSPTLWVAIVVGTGVFGIGNNFSVKSISLQPGSIPTIPASQTEDQVLLDSQRYYQKSFPPDVVPDYAVSAPGAITYRTQVNGVIGYGVPVVFPATMNSTPIAKFWSLLTPNSSTWTNLFSGFSGTFFDSGPATTILGLAGSEDTLSPNGMSVFNTQTVADTLGTPIGVHYTLDARLGY